MHTVHFGEYTTFHYNGDYSGDVIIKRHGISDSGEMRLPIDALEFFIAEAIRARKIEKLEQATTKQILEER